MEKRRKKKAPGGDWRAKARQRVKQKEEGGKFKLGVGRNVFRILPSKYGSDYPNYVNLRVHREVGPDSSSVACGKDEDGRGRCWLCSQIDGLLKSKSSKNRARAASMKPQDQFVFQVSRIDENTEEFLPPQIFYASTGGARSVGVRLLGKLSEDGSMLDDLTRGYNLMIKRTGTGPRDTRYDPPERDDASTSVPKSVRAKMFDLQEEVPQYREALQKSLYYGKPIEQFEDAEEEEPEDESAEEPEEETEEASEEDYEEEPEEYEEEDEGDSEEYEEEEDETDSEEEEPEDEEEEYEEEEEPEEDDSEPEEEEYEEEPDEEEEYEEEEEEDYEEEEEEYEEEEPPLPPKRPARKKPPAKKAPAKRPAKKSPTKRPPTKKAPAKKPAAKKATKKAPAKRPAKKAVKKAPRKR